MHCNQVQLQYPARPASGSQKDFSRHRGCTDRLSRWSMKLKKLVESMKALERALNRGLVIFHQGIDNREVNHFRLGLEVRYFYSYAVRTEKLIDICSEDVPT